MLTNQCDNNVTSNYTTKLFRRVTRILLKRRGLKSKVLKLKLVCVSFSEVWGIFCKFLEEKSHFNAIWMTFCTFVKLFENHQLLRFGSPLTELNYLVFLAYPLTSWLTSKHVCMYCIFGLNFLNEFSFSSRLGY